MPPDTHQIKPVYQRRCHIDQARIQFPSSISQETMTTLSKQNDILRSSQKSSLRTVTWNCGTPGISSPAAVVVATPIWLRSLLKISVRQHQGLDSRICKAHPKVMCSRYNLPGDSVWKKREQRLLRRSVDMVEAYTMPSNQRFSLHHMAFLRTSTQCQAPGRRIMVNRSHPDTICMAKAHHRTLSK